MTAGAGVVLLGGGAGTRLGLGAKILVQVGGTTLLDRAVRWAATNVSLRAIVVVAPPDMAATIRLALRQHRIGVDLCVVEGGVSRHSSAHRGIAALDPELPFVAVCDVARPFAPPAVVDDLIECLTDPSCTHVGAIPTQIPADTIHEVGADGVIVRTPPRTELVCAQTPQVFRTAALRLAYERASDSAFEGTDDADVVHRSGSGDVLCVPGSTTNFKITDEVDLERAHHFHSKLKDQ